MLNLLSWRSPTERPYDPARFDALVFQERATRLLQALEGMAADVKALSRDLDEVKYARDVAASVRRGQAGDSHIDVKAFERAVREMRADYEARLGTKSMGQWRAPYPNLKIVSLE